MGTVLAEFGGGGHACASGHDIAGPFTAARDRVLTALRAAMELTAKQQGSPS